MRVAYDGIKKGQTPFGAAIVKEGCVIATAHNEVWETTDITAHAEICAIRLACTELRTINLKGCVIYSTCEPCPMCFSAIHWAGISRIVYGSRISDAREVGFRELALSNRTMKRLGRSPVIADGPYLREECLRLFATWSKSKRKRLY